MVAWFQIGRSGRFAQKIPLEVLFGLEIPFALFALFALAILRKHSPGEHFPHVGVAVVSGEVFWADADAAQRIQKAMCAIRCH
jgi:hypothetical protein